MKKLEKCLDELLTNKNENVTQQIYQLLSHATITDNNFDIFITQIIPKIFMLINNQQLKKEYVYLSLLPNADRNLLQRLFDYDLSITTFDVTNFNFLFDFCLITNRHWLLDILYNENMNCESQFSQPVNSLIKMLRLINVSNCKEVNLEEIEKCLRFVHVEDDFMKFYVTKLSSAIDVVRLCQKYPKFENGTEVSEIYFSVFNESLLNIFIKFIDLQSYNACRDVLQILNRFHSDTEFEQFTAFFIIFNVIRCLKMCKSQDASEITNIIKDVELKLASMSNLNLQFELLENIFAFLFLQEEGGNLKYIYDGDVANFYCCEKEVRLLLMFLKSTTDDIKRRNPFDKTMPEFKRFNDFNKLLVDALWRLELIADYEYNQRRRIKIDRNIVKYMLAPPDTLVKLCLKQNDLNKVQQVVKIFNLEKSPSVSEVNYNTKLMKLKKQLRKSSKIQLLTKTVPVAEKTTIIQKFFESNPIIENEKYEEIISYDHNLSFFSTENSIFMNIFDLAITQCDSFQECQELLNIAITYNTVDSNTESSYSQFCKTILKLFSETKIKNTATIKEILCTPEFNFDLNEYAKYEEFYFDLAATYDLFNNQLISTQRGKLNSKHIAHKTFLKLQELCLCYNQQEEQVKYLSRILNYLKSFSKIFYIEGNNSQIISKGSDTSYFEIFEFGRSDILEKLLFEKKLDLLDFEVLFSKLKLDLVYTVSAIFFPKIKLDYNAEDTYCDTKSVNLPSNHIIAYIQKRNWLLALILCKMYDMPIMPAEVNHIRTKTLINFLELPRIYHLRNIFDNNNIIAGLQNKIDIKFIKLYFEKHVIKSEMVDDNQPNILTSQTSTCSYETAEELFEGDLKITNWKHLYDVVNSIPQHQLLCNKKILDLRDMALSNLISDCFEPDYFKYVHLIHDDEVRRKCILDNMTTWPGDFCIDILISELSSFKGIDGENAIELRTWLDNIKLYEAIKLIMEKDSWYQVFLLCKSKPQEVLESLLNTDKVNLLLQFINLHEISSEKLEIIDVNYFMMLLESNVTIPQIEKLLNKLSINHLIYVCFHLLKVLKKLEHLNFITTFIVDSNLDDSNVFRNIQTSLKMLSCFSTSEHEHLWSLIADPICILEVLIMNTKFDKLGQVLNKIKPDLENCEFDENRLSVEKIDDILLKYAEKSLEFRVVLRPWFKTKSSESSKLLQSIDSVFFYPNHKNFVMPSVVPKKSDWIPNTEVLECMCCLDSTFSMFNRRHHCRRCGRVICGTCSLKRMQVSTYDDIPVRVCLDCYEQSRLFGTSSSKSETSSKSSDWEYWLLTDDINHNHLVREEFSYEYAPSVSLCLAILKHHSKNENYPRFLLNQCDGMLKLLQPTNSEHAEEIDYLLVIKMLKSLALAAKMISAECLLQWGTSLADRILSQADLLGLLAERGCLYLIPDCTQSSGRYIDAATLRRLRDKLLEMEQWNLALEVSTKAGLDNSGVFAAWGKSCLKAGCLQLAREKFQRCFEKSGFFETSSDLSDSYSSVQVQKMFRKPIPEHHSSKNPPVLNEIISMLESTTCAIHPHLLREIKSTERMFASTCSLNSSVNQSLQNDPAICILNKLKNLSTVMAGNYSYVSDFNESIRAHKNKGNLEPIFYEECVYYLTTYGTHLSLLEFYIKHDHLYECLKYILESAMSSEMFIAIYMLCLQNNVVDALQENMSKIDCTLDMWKDYLKAICCYLEKQSKLHSLYQLQQFMGDFVRAAMTCIKFYQDGVRTYSELNSRIHHLHKAQEHLQQELEQEQWVVATVQKSGFDSHHSFEAKGITNPSLVMKMDSKNVDKHITTISRQIELTKFLADYEQSGTWTIIEILSYGIEDFKSAEVKIPTLFGTLNERMQLAVLAIVCGNNVEDGFGIGYRIIQDYKLNPGKVYCQAGKQLARTENYSGIAQLVSCIRANGIDDTTITNICDEMLILAVQTLRKASSVGAELDSLIKLITDRNIKITAYIETKQLKSAYLLAAKYKRIGDIRRILKEAETINQINIKILCQRFLSTQAHSKD